MCINNKDLSEERCLEIHSSLQLFHKNLCGDVLQNGEFLFEKTIQALKTNGPLHNELSNALYKKEFIKVPHAKLAEITLTFLQL